MTVPRQLSFLPPAPGGPLGLERPGLVLRHWPSWLEQPHRWLEQLLVEVPWKQEWITVHGRRHPLPRLTAAMGDPGCQYRYSGVANPLEPWSPAVQALRERVERQLAGASFTNVLLNLYRDGYDHMGWHADAEPSLDPAAPIASLSLGASRCFRFRPAVRPATAGDGRWPTGVDLELASGDLLVMDPPTQQHWQHQVPPRRRIRETRLNLTFRRVLPGGS